MPIVNKSAYRLSPNAYRKPQIANSEQRIAPLEGMSGLNLGNIFKGITEGIKRVVTTTVHRMAPQVIKSASGATGNAIKQLTNNSGGILNSAGQVIKVAAQNPGLIAAAAGVKSPLGQLAVQTASSMITQGGGAVQGSPSEYQYINPATGQVVDQAFGVSQASGSSTSSWQTPAIIGGVALVLGLMGVLGVVALKNKEI